MTNDVVSALRERTDELALAMVKRLYATYPDDYGAYDPSQHSKSVRDMGYHLDYLVDALAVEDVALFVDYCDWAAELFDNLGFAPEMLLRTLASMRDVISEQIGDGLATRYVDVALLHLQAAKPVSDSFIVAETPLGELARAYLDALLKGDRYRASQLVTGQVKQGTPVRNIYMEVFQPSQREIGRLWQTNQVSVAQEHYCTAATQMIMSQLYPYIFGAERVGRRLVATCVGGELHEIGVRMVADFFEMAGWDTYYIGANTPPESVVRAVEEQEPDVLAISATMTFHVRSVAQLVEYVRSQVGNAKLGIMVGGYPFNVSPGLWKTIGADGFAPDADRAVETASTLVEGGAVS